MKKYSDFCFYAQLLFEVGGYCFIKSYVTTDGQFKSWNNIFCYLLCNVKSKLKIALKFPFLKIQRIFICFIEFSDLLFHRIFLIKVKSKPFTQILPHILFFLITVEPRKTGQPSGQTKVSVLERCPPYRGSEKHWRQTKRVKCSAYCGREGSDKHKNSIIEQSKDLTVNCIL